MTNHSTRSSIQGQLLSCPQKTPMSTSKFKNYSNRRKCWFKEQINKRPADCHKLLVQMGTMNANCLPPTSSHGTPRVKIMSSTWIGVWVLWSPVLPSGDISTDIRPLVWEPMNRHMENNIGGLEVCVCVHQVYTWELTYFGTSKQSGMLAKMAGTDVVNVGRINSGRCSDLCVFLEREFPRGGETYTGTITGWLWRKNGT